MTSSNQATSANVVQLNVVKNGLHNPRYIMGQCEAEVTKALSALFTGVFHHADDVFFDMADHAQSNQMQEMYLDAMREVRRKGAAMEKLFQSALHSRFDEFDRHPGSIPKEASAPASRGVDRRDFILEADDDTLALVAEDELEESLAINNMASKASVHYSQFLEELTHRVAHLYGRPPFEAEALPFGPTTIAAALRAATKTLAADIKIKLILYKLWDKDVMSALGDLYSRLNRSLVEAGILPTLKPGIRKSPGGHSTARPPEAGERDTPAPEEDEAREFLSNLQQLLSAQRRSPGWDSPISGAAPRPYTYRADDVLQALSTLQVEVAQPAGADVGFTLGQPVKPILLEQVRQRAGTDGQMRRMDEDTIDFVEMLFDFILEDHQLPPQVKAALGRLQIPMLKVALLDKTFFSRKHHPARRLLNELARAGIALTGESDRRDALYDKIDQVVGGVIDRFTDDVRVFEDLLEEFLAFAEAESQRVRVFEEREAQASEGKERLEVAKEQVQGEVERRIAGRPLPKALRRFLDETWRHHLLLAYLQNGDGGQEFRHGLWLLDGLLWSVEPKHTREERDAMLVKVQPVLKSLREVLKAELTLSDSQRTTVLREIQSCQIAALRGEDPAAEERAELARRARVSNAAQMGDLVPETAAAGTHSTEKTRNNSQGDPAATGVPTAARGHGRPDFAGAQGATPGSGVTAREDTRRPAQQYLRQAKEMPLGTWLEFAPPGEEARRIKLSWRTALTAKCLFVTRRGVKALEVSAEQFAIYLRDGVARVISDTPLIDRALDAVIRDLGAPKT